jgi:D-sedoheptulose 7-phosphate isomerase
LSAFYSKPNGFFLEKNMIQQRIQESIAVKTALLNDTALLGRIETFIATMVEIYRQGGKVLFCGNGGSAGDAQHIAAELSGRFYKNRTPLYAEALHVNSSYLTAVANDYGYNEVFARMVQAAGRKGDMLVAISTSGNSPNIIRAVEEGRAKGMYIVGMTGDSGGAMAELCDLLINIPSGDTPRIQESHILVGHILCEAVEAQLFPG